MDEWIQIAGIRDQGEADLLVEYGVDGLGFPLRLPVHAEDLSEEAAAQIISTLPATATGVLITYLDDAAEIAAFCAELGASWVQLHGDITRDELARLKKIAPELNVIKSLVVTTDNLPQLESTVDALSDRVEAFITDTFDPETGASGATGRVHDWSVDRALVKRSPRPVILAGGLNPGNVQEAILTVRPAGIDAHTGVEDEHGRKSRFLIAAFVSEARRGFAEIR